MAVIMAPTEGASSEKSDRKKNEGRNSKRRRWTGDFEFNVDYNDHFETPFNAYQDILPLIDGLSPSMPKSKPRENGITERTCRKDHILYDPYYCDGRTKVYLERLGFNCVVHEKRDFYKDIEESCVPHHDTLITNPPYSDNHKEKCLEFCVQQFRERGRCFFLLMPNYVAARNYYRTTLGDSLHDVAYVVPATPYEYDHPEGTGHEAPPFASLWFCGVGRDRIRELQEVWDKDHVLIPGSRGCIPRFVSSLDQLVSLGFISVQKRPNPRQRKKRITVRMEETRVNTSSGRAEGQPMRPEKQTNTIHQPQKLDRLNQKKKTKGSSRYRDESGKRTKRRF